MTSAVIAAAWGVDKELEGAQVPQVRAAWRGQYIRAWVRSVVRFEALHLLSCHVLLLNYVVQAHGAASHAEAWTLPRRLPGADWLATPPFAQHEHESAAYCSASSSAGATIYPSQSATLVRFAADLHATQLNFFEATLKSSSFLLAWVLCEGKCQKVLSPARMLLSVCACSERFELLKI